MMELRKMAPEFKEIEKHHHVTSAMNMNYNPLRWLHEQGEPGAIKTRKTALKETPARLQQLWNAGSDDEVGSSQFHGDIDGDDKAFMPGQWLASQHDDAEMRETAPLPMPGLHRVFREDADHDRNYEGNYVSDNSIGLQVDNLKAPVQMLAMTDDQLYKGAETEHEDARNVYLAKHKRQADIAKGHPLPSANKAVAKKNKAADANGEKVLKSIAKQEKVAMKSLNKIDQLTKDSTADNIAAAETKQAEGRIAYLARHARAANLATASSSVCINIRYSWRERDTERSKSSVGQRDL